jgi:hypothetical protein
MADNYDNKTNEIKIFFEPSTIETIDDAMFRYIESLNLFTKTNNGYKKVPVIWGGSERGFQSKRELEIRNKSGILQYPIITVMRKQIDKSFSKRAVFHGNIPAVNDEQGGSFTSHRVLYQEKTNNFAVAESRRSTGQINSKLPNSKVVYRTITAPMPVNVAVNYDIMIRTEYQQQMNDLLIPFITRPGTVNFVSISSGRHRYEAFIKQDINQTSTLTNYGSEERRFDTVVPIEVIGYLISDGPNQEKPYYAVRENAVEVKIPRERAMIREVPMNPFGADPNRPFDLRTVPMSVLASNIPAAGAGWCPCPNTSAGNAGSTIVTRETFVDILGEFFLSRELLKDSGVEVPGVNIVAGKHTYTLSNKVKINSETVYINGLAVAVGADKDYTINGSVITFVADLDKDDSVYVTYIIGS